MPKYAFDWDGVIVERSGIPTDSYVWNDNPMDGALSTLNYLRRQKIDFYILTNRNKKERNKIKDWLRQWGFPDNIKVTRSKQPNTTIYLDDRAVRFTSWNDFRKLIL